MKMRAIQSVVRKAGKMILEAHVGKDEIHSKVGPANFVTDYDVKIQQFLIEKLSLLLPAQKSSNAYSNHSTTADFFLKNAGTR